MSTPIAAPTTNWTKKEWQISPGRRAGMIRGLATLAAGSQFYMCPINLPARCKPVWSAIVNQTAIDVQGGTTTDATNAANAIALCMYPAAATATIALTTPATGSASSHTNILNLCPSVASCLVASQPTGTVGHIRGSPLGTRLLTNVQMENPQNLEALLLLRPANTNSNRVVAASAATNTDSNMTFGTSTTTSTVSSGLVQVSVYYEQCDDPQTTFTA